MINRMNKENYILFLGDVVPYRKFVFRSKYRAVINLESPIIKEGMPVPGKINLKAGANHLGEIFGRNLLCASLGNNHILDYGTEGLDSTLKELGKINSGWFGVYDLKTGSRDPFITEFNNIRIAFFSAVCPTTSPVAKWGSDVSLNILETDTLAGTIQGMRSSVDRIVVCIHWGAEESSYPRSEDVITARKLVDAGADIIIGTHPHAPQSVERYKNGIIAYSLGNFIMPGFRTLPSYYDNEGNSTSFYDKKIMLWNRISWGILVNPDTMKFRILKYIFLGNRIFSLLVTPCDKYIKLHRSVLTDQDGTFLENHLRQRNRTRRLLEFIARPHIPQSIKKIL
jgi:poly-gamma-glutamate synthesis protein (capsule biosynthesis protein)